MKAEDILEGETLGKGASGLVYKAQWRGVTVAVKELYVGSDSKLLADFSREVHVLRKVRFLSRADGHALL